MSESSFHEIITLNVGGKLYSTTRATLLGTGSPSGEETYFHALLSGRLSTTRDKDGNIFIDRDGKLFYYILGYLRTGHWRIDDLGAATKAQIREEASYYLLEKSVVGDYLSISRNGRVPSDADIDDFYLYLDSEKKKSALKAEVDAFKKDEPAWLRARAAIATRFARVVALKKHFSHEDPLSPIFVMPKFENLREAVDGWNERFPFNRIDFASLTKTLRSSFASKLDVMEDAEIFQAKSDNLITYLARRDLLSAKTERIMLSFVSSQEVIIWNESASVNAKHDGDNGRHIFHVDGRELIFFGHTCLGWMLVSKKEAPVQVGNVLLTLKIVGQ